LEENLDIVQEILHVLWSEYFFIRLLENKNQIKVKRQEEKKKKKKKKKKNQSKTFKGSFIKHFFSIFRLIHDPRLLKEKKIK